ncbi:TadE/TadG family type IV pilus assembly protein [Pseudomonas sp. FW300-N2F2]|uniref:TadE/TadG family type IV pilus assembly protein n=1 Tax=Pseudomonas sp. FW300-N2F2 TaxID=2751320 RepID=UPI001A92963D|nr:hypothetical protein [Pseudomonas sp. FW300-N2F2]
MRLNRKTRRSQRGIAAVETAFMMPVILIGLMMFFELARVALVVVVGNLALESALASLRRDTRLDFTNAAVIQGLIQTRMVDASWGVLGAGELAVQVRAYANLQEFADIAHTNEDDNAAPVVTVEVNLTENYITALPALLSLPQTFNYQYRHVLGNLPKATTQ